MPAPENRIKTRLRAGAMQFGCWLDLGSIAATEIAGRAGFDWCLIDAEHSPFDMPAIRDQLVALKSVDCPAAVRVPANEDWILKQVLDLGVQTVLVPMVDMRDEAVAAVRAVQYPPKGIRGLAPGIVRTSDYGRDGGYIATANDQICLMVQAESRAAVENIDDIAATPGIDCVFVGPFDLAADMGQPGDPRAPEVAVAIDHIMARTKAAGKPVGIFCADPSALDRYVEHSATFVTVASDVGALRAGLGDTLSAAQARLTR